MTSKEFMAITRKACTRAARPEQEFLRKERKKAARPMFHVKRRGRNGTLLSNTKIAEDHIENIVHVDAAGETTKRASREPELLSEQLVGRAPTESQRTSEGLGGLTQQVTMALARHQRGLSA